MIGTFWNLCSACPSMPVDKLHSEYRSTYRWHEYTGPRQDVIKHAPQPVTDDRIEPAFPRRKKNPALAHRTHEILATSDGCASDDSAADTANLDRARSGERGGARQTRRSKSEGPPVQGPPVQSEYRLRYGLSPRARARPRVSRSDSDPCRFDKDTDQLVMIAYLPDNNNQCSSTAGVFKSAVNRISTEYRLQFAWPRGGGGGGGGVATDDQMDGEGGGAAGPPRKSLSMGAIKPTGGHIVPTHKKRPLEDTKTAAELEPLVSMKNDTIDNDDGEEKIQEESISKEEKPLLRNEFNTEYKKKFRPFSQYNYVEGKFKPKKEPEQLLAELQSEDSWYQEVLELRRKAGEYKMIQHRGWGTELVPQHIAELYNKQITLWEQVSRRSSLSALSLASTTPKLISKEEKDKENNKKSSPTKTLSARHSPIKPFSIYDKPSVTYKKMDKYEDNKKDKRSRKEANALRRQNLERSGGGRSQSVGPTATFTEKSLSTSPKRTKAPASNKPPQIAPAPGPASADLRRPRPTTLTTTAPSRTKSCSGSIKVNDSKVKPPITVSPATASSHTKNKTVDKKKRKEQIEEPERERVVKSPPEPTRVKSPEQILMRSPEPVNWTVPLDTGKTFTVTQNVHEGELVGRPHSEVKPWTAATVVPPPAPQSAPPQLEEHPSGWKSPDSDCKGSLSKLETAKSPETSLKCIDDPSFAFDAGKESSLTAKDSESHDPALSPSVPQKSLATDVFEKARNRFDNFWGKGKEESCEKEGQV
ncbi:nuclear protein MDM1 isoform X5 [Nilaparvata lugens]|uniref:nuclear protein MDM1 isoform X4 n=1 Tax=Nilaparvata lugens TaxID=108931 RepID=UPI00193D5F34|nr:nuclear protein MDM1 isoform X4 [Nilaparvata lugens]XP_039298527.1 nuclear protein MDM1 isoform X5 [Nilaparvata lugens]